MATSEPATEMTPMEYLKQADKEMAAGNGQKAAGLLWKATEATLVGLAKKREIQYRDDLSQLAIALEADGSVEKRHYRARVVTAKILREHAETEIMEDDELEGTYAVMRNFLVGCNGAPE